MALSPKSRTKIVSDLANAPDYLPGDVYVLDPCNEPRHGCMMVARLPTLGVSILAACLIVGSGASGEPIYELVPLKEGYPTFSSRTDSIELLAVVAEHHRDLRNR